MFESAYTPDCLVCGNRMGRAALSDILAGDRQRDIYKAQAERLQYNADKVWYCESCNIIHPFEFAGKQEAHRPIVDHADDANCPSCGYDLVRLGGCERFKAFQKIYYCQFCIASARSIAIFGFTKPKDSAHFYFTRLDPDDVRARLDYVENEDLLFTVRPGSISPGQVHRSLTKFRDMFRKDPEHAFHAMSREDLRTIRFILAYAYNYNPGNPAEARKLRVREALQKHRYEKVECPCADHFKRIELGPERTVLECKTGHRNLLVYAAGALCVLGVSIATGTPELICFGALIAICMFAYIALRITARTRFIVEGGAIRVAPTALVPSFPSAELIRVTEVSLGRYCKALGPRRVVEITQDAIDSDDTDRKPIPRGLLLMHEGKKTFAPVKGTYSDLLWMRRVILEAAKAQGICET